MIEEVGLFSAWDKAPQTLRDVRDALPGGPPGWRPSRLILQNYWLFNHDEFHFVHGRLVLRGANATGKSTVLVSAITLALDGEKRRERLDPFGGQGRSVDYYLLGLRDATPDSDFYFDERTGYVALEFEHPGGRHLTIGVGLYASRSRADAGVDSWGFVITDGRRIGQDLNLYDQERRPLTRRQLVNLIGSGGEVVDRARDYQSLVNTSLFGFSDPDDFAFLLDLLVQLRSPKLNRDTKPSVICQMLSESLPPLGAALLDEVTGIINDIDACAQDIEITGRQLAAAKAVDGSHLELLQYEAQLAACALRAASAHLCAEEERSAQFRAELEQASVDLEAAQTRLRALADEDGRDAARIDALEHSELYRDIGALARMQQDADDALRGMQAADRAVQDSTAGLQAADGRVKALASEWAALREGLAQRTEDLTRSAVQAAWPAAEEAAAHARRDVDGMQPGADLPARTAALEGLSEARLALLAEVRRRRQAVESAQAALDSAKSAAELARKSLEEATERELAAEEGLLGRRGEAVSALDAWLQGSTVLHPSAELSRAALRTLEGFPTEGVSPSVAHQAVLAPLRAAADDVAERLRATSATISAALGQARLELDRIADELTSWRTERDPVPPRSAGQEAARRALRAAGVESVPLYAVCDFAPGVPDGLKVQIEEGLLASGLLDALVVAPQDAGQAERILGEAGLGDLWIRPVAPWLDGASLNAVLVPAADPARESSAAVALASIAWAADAEFPSDLPAGAPAALSPAGWRVGALTGTVQRSVETAPLYVGEENRRRHREEIIARLRSQLADAEAEVARLSSEAAAVAERLGALRAEVAALAGLPVWDALLRAADELQSARLRTPEFRERLERADAREQAVRAEVTAARGQLEDALGRIGEARGRDLDGLRDLEEATRRVAERSREFVRAQTAIPRWRARQETAAVERTAAHERLARDTAEFERAKTRRTAAEERLAVLRQHLAGTQGKAEELLAEIRQLKLRREEIRAEERDLTGRASVSRDRCERLTQQLDEAAQDLSRAQDVRAERRRELLSAAARHPAIVEGSAADDPDVLADWLLRQRRAANERLEALVQSDRDAAHLRLATVLAERRHDLVDFSPEHDESGRVVTFRHEGQRVATWTLTKILTEQDVLHQSLLQTQERHLYEEVILREVARQIRDRIDQASQWCEVTNDLLGDHPLSNGEVLSLGWSPVSRDAAGTLDTARVVELLKREADTLTQEEIEELIGHFRHHVEDVRQRYAEDRIGEQSFAQALAQVLDYRAWFGFRLYAKTPAEPRRELTDHRFAARSGAEKSLAMFIPILVAVDARYAMAAGDAPRLVGLDEAFAGVDERNIREMFRLLVDMNFSWIMTSEKLWGVADTLPGCSTYDLIKSGATVAPLWTVWDGTRRLDAMGGG